MSKDNGNRQRQVVPYFGFSSVLSLSKVMDSFFNSMISEFPDFSVSHSYIERCDDAYTLNIELPGYDKNEVKVTAHDGCIHVRAEHREKNKFLRSEDSFSLPKDALIPEQITGKLEKGILTIRFPREKAKDAELKGTEIRVE